MEISTYKHIYQNTSIDDVVSGLSSGLRSEIPYSDSQIYTIARLTAVVVKGSEVLLFDNEFSNADTVELIMELENGVHGLLEKNYDATMENGGGVVAALEVS